MSEKNYWFIGDIHGELALLDRLLDSILRYEPAEIIFLGDYIDRGPQSREVIDLIRSLRLKTTCLMGNHELMLLQAVEDSPWGQVAMELWYRNGGEATLLSFGFPGFFGFQSELQDPYLSFFRELKMTYQLPLHDHLSLLAVHAGLSSGIPLKDQLAIENYRELQEYMSKAQLDPGSSFLWVREDFFRAEPESWSPFLVLHGHTPVPKLVRYVEAGRQKDFHFVEQDLCFRRSGDDRSWASVCIDSGSVYSGRLSGLGFFHDPEQRNKKTIRIRSLTVSREDTFPREYPPLAY